VRERAQRTVERQSSGQLSFWQRFKHVFGFVGVGASFIAKPFKFVGHYVIPPYFRNSWRELQLVTWPTRKQTRQLTVAVIMFSIVLGTFVALLDLGFGKLFKQVIIK
jgi:preprotein translocase subunit SecE